MSATAVGPGAEISFGAARPYKIAIPDAELERMHAFAALTKLDKHAANTLDAESKDVSQYGLPPQMLSALVERLRSGYDWRAEEAAMNALGEHSIIPLMGIPDEGELDMHVVHRRSKDPTAIPLMLTHGWPGSFFEFRYLAPLLTEGTPAFHVVMPSLPGFTFSGAPKHCPAESNVPWTNTKLALCCDAVMRALGYDAYVAQGGDIGSIVTRLCAHLFPERCHSIHLNISPVPMKAEERANDEEKRGYERAVAFGSHGSAYGTMQGTTPYVSLNQPEGDPFLDADGYTDSRRRSGAEKWYRWSSPVKSPTLDEVLTNSLLYYLSGSLTSSFWFYYNMTYDGDASSTLTATTRDTPVGFSIGHYELFWCSKSQAQEDCPQLKSYNLLSSGSHFLAQEEPELLAKEMRAHFGQYGLRSDAKGGGAS